MRFCDNPTPSGNGSDCVGNSEKTSECPFYIDELGLNHTESILFIVFVCVIVIAMLGSAIFAGVKKFGNKGKKYQKNNSVTVEQQNLI